MAIKDWGGGGIKDWGGWDGYKRRRGGGDGDKRLGGRRGGWRQKTVSGGMEVEGARQRSDIRLQGLLSTDYLAPSCFHSVLLNAGRLHYHHAFSVSNFINNSLAVWSTPLAAEI